MPELCRIDGIIISMHLNDHVPPHIHERLAEYRISVSLKPIEITRGQLPARKQRLLLEWVRKRNPQLHQALDPHSERSIRRTYRALTMAVKHPEALEQRPLGRAADMIPFKERI